MLSLPLHKKAKSKTRKTILNGNHSSAEVDLTGPIIYDLKTGVASCIFAFKESCNLGGNCCRYEWKFFFAQR